MTTFAAARSATMDDVVVSVAPVELDERSGIRIELAQLAVEDKNYVDLSPRDAIWLAYAILRVVEEMLG